ncbi:DNA cytosine methyltransferase [Neisseria leonii]|uniref:DNA cytosine methyltransferase n=1 Tax=Neisseria leonii TaxID=2995413 RepID=UPI00237BCFF8|nr:DNA cytosine methyltransferase [Neisseria sp. 3986]MDD9325698.1 DNA cytosine methyltransferase [Neisseria sp. 3986]
MQHIKFIDLFSGMSGIRKGFEAACLKQGLSAECVFTSEIKPAALTVLKQNYPDEIQHGDITAIHADDIPEFDVLLAGFPCQAFSFAGKRLGFEDTRGTLFFDVARILEAKKPKGFILENVEGLVTHDRQDPKQPIGRTLSVILETLNALGYHVSWKVLNAKDFGVPQNRKRIYLAGSLKTQPDFSFFRKSDIKLKNILETGLPTQNSPFIKKILAKYPVKKLYGKSVKDKRGGANNIHSWDIELKGPVSDDEKALLNCLLKERRKKKWAGEIGIEWMDGMPLTKNQIATFYPHPELQTLLSSLTEKGYLSFEHPKQKIGGLRVKDETLPKGYNIVTGKKSFEINKILDPEDIAPTLVAMDMEHLFVVDNDGLRTLTIREGLRLFGYPDDYLFDVSKKDGFDLLGNTVVVPVIEAVSEKLLHVI